MNNKTKSHMQNNELEYLSPYFFGAKAENSDTLESLLLEFVQEHVAWRKDFSPQDDSLIKPEQKASENYKQAIGRLKSELHALTGKLKKTTPTHNPRYFGKMASDLMLPALLAQLVTTFYNPNNSADDSSEITIKMELAVGKQFAELFGFNTNPEVKPCSWGHLTSGGSDANYESLWNFRAVKYYPVALVEALKLMDLKLSFIHPRLKDPLKYSLWELINLSVDDVLELREILFRQIESEYGLNTLKDYSRLVEDNRLETLGPSQFFAEHWKLHQPVVLVPATAYAFWKKAMRLLGFGSASLIKVPLTHSMRLDEVELERILEKLHTQNIPVLAVIGVLGTLDFGTIDPIHELVKIRQKFSSQGLDFYLHVDASCAGYMKTLFIDEQGKPLSRDAVAEQFSYFPSEAVYQAFMALSSVDSVTIAPHSLGYLPHGIGGFIARNREIAKLLNHSEKNLLENNDKLDLSQLSRFILDGAKPGTNAAAAFITHKVLPLNADHFGRVIKHSILSSEYFYNRIMKMRAALKSDVHLCIPFEPDTNLVAIAINPVGNRSLTVMNSFIDRLYKKLAHQTEESVKHNEFFGSTTYLELHYFTEQEKSNLFKSLDLDREEATTHSEDKVHILRHTLNNPWFAAESEGVNYLDRYCDFLEKIIIEASKKHNQ